MGYPIPNHQQKTVNLWLMMMMMMINIVSMILIVIVISIYCSSSYDVFSHANFASRCRVRRLRRLHALLGRHVGLGCVPNGCLVCTDSEQTHIGSRHILTIGI